MNVIDKANYALNAYINGELSDSIYDFGISVTTMFYMATYDLTRYCKKNKPCSFALDIELREKIVQTNPMIEVTFREVLNIPTYIQKGNAKLDYVFGDKFYYLYTDIGRNDVGEITLNFLREFGQLWARVVKKDLKVPEKEANWRKYFCLPGPGWDSLPFDEYTRKLKITTRDTEDCINGCYLLMTIQINDVGEYVPDSIFYLFSIIVKITSNKKTYNDIPKVVIQVDEYIIGSLDVTEMDDRLISEFYEIWFPHDSDQIEIDWQSSLASLYINVGGVRPTTTRADFPLRLEGTNGVLILNKEEILKKAKEKGIVPQGEKSIQDINLVIGIWTNITDSGDQELYSLRVHQHENDSESEESNNIDITIISSDQKHVCRPRKVKRGYDIIYRCLFIITFNADPNIDNPLFVYGFPTNPLSDTHLLADFISIDVYNEFDKGELKKLIPSAEKAEFNADKEGVNYIYIDQLPQDKVLFVNLYTTVEIADLDLALINSMPVYNSYPEQKLFEIYPNSYTEQIFACTKDELKLKFPVENGIAVTIEVLAGEAELNWEDDDVDKYKLKGAGDRIKLFANYINNELKIRNLKPVNGMADPGFLFFVTYKTRDPDFNFDEVPYGKSTEISYRQTDLPVVLYSKLIGLEKKKYGINVAITFKKNYGENAGQYIMSPIDITATLLDQNKIYTTKKKKDKTMKPTEDISIKGYYDPAIKTALLYLSKEKLDSYNIKDSENPYLYLRIDKKPYYKEETFDFFNVEADISGINDFIYPIEKIYHYGKLGADQDIIFYPLKLVRNKNFLRVQVALNSDQLDFSISEEPQIAANMSFPYIRDSRERGKVYITVMRPQDKDTLYLNFFRKDKSKNDERLSNYVFKYINGEAETDFFDYKMRYPNITIKEENNLLNCTFNKIHEGSGDTPEIIYFLKIVDNATYIYGEEMNTIAATESPALINFDNNPTQLEGDEDKLSITVPKDYSTESVINNYAYINIVAQIRQNNIIEYVAYNGIMNIRPPTPSSDDDRSDKPEESKTNNTVLFGVIGGVLGLIVIGLIVVIVYFQIKNRTLLNQVKHVSFQKTNTNMDPNLLLQKQQEISPS